MYRTRMSFGLMAVFIMMAVGVFAGEAGEGGNPAANTGIEASGKKAVSPRGTSENAGRPVGVQDESGMANVVVNTKTAGPGTSAVIGLIILVIAGYIVLKTWVAILDFFTTWRYCPVCMKK